MKLTATVYTFAKTCLKIQHADRYFLYLKAIFYSADWEGDRSYVWADISKVPLTK